MTDAFAAPDEEPSPSGPPTWLWLWFGGQLVALFLPLLLLDVGRVSQLPEPNSPQAFGHLLGLLCGQAFCTFVPALPLSAIAAAVFPDRRLTAALLAWNAVTLPLGGLAVLAALTSLVEGSLQG
ncbi:MAG: hypothetical protein EP330_08060 [Deltaproteobacteria bacterium]|nr:MAG: hypothetical protein EP330_08060 [Deltaproteobacteria bacterium]